MTEPSYEVLDINPDLAMSWLERNTHNRNLRQGVVNKYAADMAEKNWDAQNGQTIVVADDGRIVDGQHRLWAIVQSDTTQRMLVVTNVPMTAQLNVDSQVKRSFADTLKLNGETRWFALAAVVRRVNLWQAGSRRGTGNYSPSNAQLLATLEKHPDLRECTSMADRVRRVLPLSASIAGLCYWLFSHIDYDDCEGFYALVLGNHDGLPRGHPVRTLTDTLTAQQTSRARLNDTTQTAYVIKAWNAYRDGKDLGLLRFKPGGVSPERFPEPR